MPSEPAHKIAPRALSALPIFQGLSEEACRRLREHLRLEVVEPGAVVFQEGGSVETMHVVLAGRLALLREGRRVVEVGPGSIVGETSLLEPGPQTATGLATERLTLVSLSRRALEDLAERGDPIALRIALNLGRSLVRRLRRLRDARLEEAERRGPCGRAEVADEEAPAAVEEAAPAPSAPEPPSPRPAPARPRRFERAVYEWQLRADGHPARHPGRVAPPTPHPRGA